MQIRILAAVLVAAVGCSEPAAPASSHVGAYPLRTVDGNPLPQIVVSNADGTESIVGGLVLLRQDNTYVDSTEVQIVTSSGVTLRQDVARGPYRIAGDSVFFAFQGAEYAMALDGAELVQDFNGIELVYRR
jgi:hypothetical protein